MLATAPVFKSALLENEPKKGKNEVSAKSRERFAINKSYSIENGYPSRRRSLVDDAKFESSIKKQQKQTWIKESRNSSLDIELSEEELFLLSAVPDKVTSISLLLGIPDGIAVLPRILKTIENFKGTINHVESRNARDNSDGKEVLLRVDIEKEPLTNLLKAFHQGSSVSFVNLIPDKDQPAADIWFPQHISDLDHCNHLMTKYEPDLDMDHPGFSDIAYRGRRKEIADIAFTFRYGEKIPLVTYRPEEIATWGEVFKELDKLVPTHACHQYIKVWNLLKNSKLYAPDHIPQLQDVSDFMKRRTGFTLRPAAGLLTARDFLASLSFRVFQCTQYVRHHSSPHHSPEPDIIHELLGHAPLLADEEFAEFSQELGLCSLGASDEEIEKFATMYWFTVEFGLCREGREIRAWGAGLLSSFGELKHALSDKPEHRPFNPPETAIQPYQDQDYQDVYFVADTVEDAQAKMREWATKTVKRNFQVQYDPLTQSIWKVDDATKVKSFIRQILHSANHLAMQFPRLQVTPIAK